MLRLLLALPLVAFASAASAQDCPTGLTIMGAVCVTVDADCDAGVSLNGGSCLLRQMLAADASCDGTGVSMSGTCLAFTEPDAPEAASARAALARAIQPEPAGPDPPGTALITDVADLPPGFGQLPAHLTPACMDGLDNDRQSDVDYPESGCSSMYDHEETPEAGEGEHERAFDRVVIDSDVQRANLLFAQGDRESVFAESRAIQDHWYRHAISNGLIPDHNYFASSDPDDLTAALSRLGDQKRTYSWSDRHPVEREWNGQVDFAFGWGRAQSMEVNVILNAMGLVDVRSWGGSVANPTWGPFDGETERVHVSDPDVRVHEYNRLRSSYLDRFRPAPPFFLDAEVVYLTPDLRYIVQVKTRSNSGGTAARMSTPEGWRMVGAPISIGPWNICTSGELTQPASGLTCDGNQGRAAISRPPSQSPYVQ